MVSTGSCWYSCGTHIYTRLHDIHTSGQSATCWVTDVLVRLGHLQELSQIPGGANNGVVFAFGATLQPSIYLVSFEELRLGKGQIHAKDRASYSQREASLLDLLSLVSGYSASRISFIFRLRQDRYRSHQGQITSVFDSRLTPGKVSI